MGNLLYQLKFHLIPLKVFFDLKSYLFEFLIFKFISHLKLNNSFQVHWLIISIANKDEVVNVALKEDLISETDEI